MSSAGWPACLTSPSSNGGCIATEAVNSTAGAHDPFGFPPPISRHGRGASDSRPSFHRLVPTAGRLERVCESTLAGLYGYRGGRGVRAGLASDRSPRRPSEADRKVGRDGGVGHGRRVRRASSAPRWSVLLVPGSP